MGRGRFGLVVVAATILLVSLSAGRSRAHHGFDGRYDASNPLYVEGTVVEANYGFPHATMQLRVPEGVRVPGRLRGLPELQNVEGQRTARELSVLGRTGRAEILLPPPMTSEAAALPDRPEPGDTVAAIAYPDCDTGELRVQLLTFGDEVLVRQGQVQTEVRGCPGGGAGEEPGAGGQAQTAEEAGAGEPEAVGTREVTRRPGGFPTATILGAAAVVVVVATAGFVVLRGRRA